LEKYNSTYTEVSSISTDVHSIHLHYITAAKVASKRKACEASIVTKQKKRDGEEVVTKCKTRKKDDSVRPFETDLYIENKKRDANLGVGVPAHPSGNRDCIRLVALDWGVRNACGYAISEVQIPTGLVVPPPSYPYDFTEINLAKPIQLENPFEIKNCMDNRFEGETGQITSKQYYSKTGITQRKKAFERNVHNNQIANAAFNQEAEEMNLHSLKTTDVDQLMLAARAHEKALVGQHRLVFAITLTIRYIPYIVGLTIQLTLLGFLGFIENSIQKSFG
jgi:hypothetical protein